MSSFGFGDPDKRSKFEMFSPAEQQRIMDIDSGVEESSDEKDKRYKSQADKAIKQEKKSKRSAKMNKIADAMFMIAAAAGQGDQSRKFQNIIAMREEKRQLAMKRKHEKELREIDFQFDTKLQQQRIDAGFEEQRRDFAFKREDQQRDFDQNIIMLSAQHDNDLEILGAKYDNDVKLVYANATVEQRNIMLRSQMDVLNRYVPDVDPSSRAAFAQCTMGTGPCNTTEIRYIADRLSVERSREKRIQDDDAASVIAARMGNIPIEYGKDEFGNATVPIMPTHSQIRGLLPPGHAASLYGEAGQREKALTTDGPTTAQYLQGLEESKEGLSKGDPAAYTSYTVNLAGLAEVDPDNFGDIDDNDALESMIEDGATREGFAAAEMNVNDRNYAEAKGRTLGREYGEAGKKKEDLVFAITNSDIPVEMRQEAYIAAQKEFNRSKNLFSQLFSNTALGPVNWEKE